MRVAEGEFEDSRAPSEATRDAFSSEVGNDFSIIQTKLSPGQSIYFEGRKKYASQRIDGRNGTKEKRQTAYSLDLHWHASEVKQIELKVFLSSPK